MEEKNLQLDRMVFFCDAVVAIAITLLALGLKIDIPANQHLTFKDILGQWQNFAGFTLSFLNIAAFWKNHHSFFAYLKKVDGRFISFNIAWLFFITLLPFSTSVLSSHFTDVPAVFLYCANTFLITILQNIVCDYSLARKDFTRNDILQDDIVYQYRLYANLDMINALIAVVLSFFYPMLAFIFLFTKLPLIIIARTFFGNVFRPKHSRPHKFDR